jgi:hypothetical protein
MLDLDFLGQEELKQLLSLQVKGLIRPIKGPGKAEMMKRERERENNS